ncbi:hypothetical protein VTK56DRAFT_5860 [Thermocarpiscus australiensis]
MKSPTAFVTAAAVRPGITAATINTTTVTIIITATVAASPPPSSPPLLKRIGEGGKYNTTKTSEKVESLV